MPPNPSRILGVNAAVSETARIYYSHHFKSRSVGRVSDLIAACVRDRNLDPLELRGSILYALYIGYCVCDESVDTGETPPHFSLEVGVDESTVAISLSVHLDAAHAAGLEPVRAAVQAKNYAEGIPRRLFELGKLVRSLDIRFAVREQTLDLLFYLGGAHPAEPAITWNDLETIEAAGPIAGDYVELGDIEYMKELGTHLKVAAEAEVEAVVRLANDARTAGEEQIRISGDAKEQAEVDRRMAAEAKVAELAAQRIAGNVPADAALTPTRIASASSDVPASDSIRFGGTNTPESDLRVSSPKAMANDAALEAKISDLMAKLALVERERDQMRENAANQRLAKKGEPSALGFLKNLWPIKPVSPASAESPSSLALVREPSATDGPSASVAGKGNAPTNALPASAHPGDSDPDLEAAVAASPTVEAISRLEKMNGTNESEALSKIFQEMELAKNDPKAREWKEALKREVLVEKARLADVVKDLGRQARQREMAYVAKERTAATELRKREELLRQKETIIQQKNEQLAQANMNMERVKSSGGSAEEQGMKLKIANAQKINQVKDEEIKALTKKMNDLENKLMNAQSKSAKSPDLQANEKLMAAEKRLEEMKRQNQRLTETLTKAQEKRVDPETADAKRRLELAERQLGETKKTLEKSALKMKESLESERKLQIELGKVQDDNKKLRQSLTRLGMPSDDEAA